MRKSNKIFLLALFGLASSCNHADRDRSTGVCGNENNNRVCAVPFEFVYSNREALIDRHIRLEGTLVVGTRPEPPGSGAPVALLFPSSERARLCNQEFAVEIIPATRKIADELSRANGTTVSVVGRMTQSFRGHWGQMDILASPASVSGAKADFECMNSPPPPLPEPEEKERS